MLQSSSQSNDTDTFVSHLLVVHVDQREPEASGAPAHTVIPAAQRCPESRSWAVTSTSAKKKRRREIGEWDRATFFLFCCGPLVVGT